MDYMVILGCQPPALGTGLHLRWLTETYRTLPERERELLLAVVRTFRAKAVQQDDW